MLIQPILFPAKNLKNEPELFFRGVISQNISENKLIIPAGSTVSMETFFNAFSIGKWQEYTSLNNLSVWLNIQGNFEIKAFHAVGTSDDGLLFKEWGKHSEEELINLVNRKGYSAIREEIDFILFQAGNDFTIFFKKLFKEGIVYLTIKAIDKTVIYGGGYMTDVGESILNPVKFAIGICTFRREETVLGNISRIVSEIIDNSSSPLKDNLEVYIADNGRTLDVELFNNNKIHIFPNLNLGGVGGFTRTMIEAMFYDKSKAFTHIIFMDDDILLYTPVLERNFYLLQLLKPEYQKAILGAKMLYLEKMYMQHAAGVLYEDFRNNVARASRKFFDFRVPDAISANEANNKTNHSGWWYACIPRTIVNEKNLPMPLFIHFDDIEYGIRNIKNKEMYINGISVWHPSPKGKSPFWMVYYNTRNRLITMFSKPLKKLDFNRYLSGVSREIILKILQYNYAFAEMTIEAINDFIKGPSYFIALDALSLHTDLLKKKEVYVPPGEVGISKENILKKRYSNFKMAVFVQIIFTLLPTKNKIKAINADYFNIPYNYAKIYLYEEKQGHGIICERSRKRFFKLLFDLLKIRKKLKREYKNLLKDWQAAKQTLTSLPFWERYLDLKKRIDQ